MKQNDNKKLIERIFKEAFPEANMRFIKIHGSKYQESGLPDLKIEVDKMHFWLEIKRDWQDDPTPIQKWNIVDLRKHGYITGFVAKDEYKSVWETNSSIKLKDFIVTISRNI